MRLGMVLVITLTFATIEARPHYYHERTIISVEQTHAGQSYVIDSPLGIFTASTQNSFRRKPHFKPGLVRVSIKPKGTAGDGIYLLDENDKEYRAVILGRKSHPPPSIGF